MKKDYKVEIDSWLETLTTEGKSLIWELVNGVNIEWELLGKDTFSLPDDKLIDRIAYTDSIKILQQLHDKGIIGFKDLVYDAEIKIKPPFSYLVSKLDQQFNRTQLDKSFVWFKNGSLFMNLPDGSPAAISFETRSKNTDILGVFETIFENWQKSAKVEDDWFEAVVTKDELEYGVWKKLKRSTGGDWLKDTISNIRKKVKASKLSKFVNLGYFNNNGWLFKIRKP